MHTPDQSALAYIGLTTDTHDTTIQKSPYSIRYYTQQRATINTTKIQIQVQLDGGANQSLTNHRELLSCYQPISNYNIYGVEKRRVALQCAGKGFYPGTLTRVIYYMSLATSVKMQLRQSSLPQI
jgi:hypothetical protein